MHITLIGIPLNQAGHPKDGMLIDFTDLKNLVQTQILSVYDHALVLNAQSPHAQIKALDENFEKIVYFKSQPTCENLLMDMVEKLQPVLPFGIDLHHLRLQETPSSSASWYSTDNI